MADPAATARAALSGIKEAVQVGREIKETAKEVNAFLDEEARARVAWKRKQQQIERRGDMMFMNAYEEYKVIRQIREAEAEMYRQIEQQYGRSAVSEVKSLINQMRKQHRELTDDFYRKRMEMRREVFWLLIVSGCVYGLFKFMGLM
jgi:phosphoglycolate phosphatase-like HAD superfamily hydrolase